VKFGDTGGGTVGIASKGKIPVEEEILSKEWPKIATREKAGAAKKKERVHLSTWSTPCLNESSGAKRRGKGRGDLCGADTSR